jgi:hypothetical protein
MKDITITEVGQLGDLHFKTSHSMYLPYSVYQYKGTPVSKLSSYSPEVIKGQIIANLPFNMIHVQSSTLNTHRWKQFLRTFWREIQPPSIRIKPLYRFKKGGRWTYLVRVENILYLVQTTGDFNRPFLEIENLVPLVGYFYRDFEGTRVVHCILNKRLMIEDAYFKKRFLEAEESSDVTTVLEDLPHFLSKFRNASTEYPGDKNYLIKQTLIKIKQNL